MKPIISIKKSPLVSNVCNQQLRELYKTDTWSLAHVEMAPKSQSLLHRHHKMTEIYFVLSETRGELSLSSRTHEVNQGSCILIPPPGLHKLYNANYTETLSHLVFALPPFDPNDVEVFTQDTYRGDILPFSLPETFVGLDGGKVYEFNSMDWKKLGISMAFGYLDEEQKAKPHYHKKTKEWYYIVDGYGKIHLNNTEYFIETGDLISVDIGVVHALHNLLSSKKLKVLAICEPAFDENDFFSKTK